MKTLWFKQVACWVMAASSVFCVAVWLVRREWIRAFGDAGMTIIFAVWAVRYGQAIRIGRAFAQGRARVVDHQTGVEE